MDMCRSAISYELELTMATIPNESFLFISDELEQTMNTTIPNEAVSVISNELELELLGHQRNDGWEGQEDRLESICKGTSSERSSSLKLVFDDRDHQKIKWKIGDIRTIK